MKYERMTQCQDNAEAEWIRDHPDSFNLELKKKRAQHDADLQTASDIVANEIYVEIVRMISGHYGGHEMLQKQEISASVPANIKDIISNEHNMKIWKSIQEKVNELLAKHQIVCFSFIYISDVQDTVVCNLFTCCMYSLWQRIKRKMNLVSTMRFQLSFIVFN